MSKKHKRNKRKERFISEVSLPSLIDSNLVERCKFNFSYLDETQDGIQSIADWNQDGNKVDSLENLIKCVKEYTTQSLSYWKSQRNLVIYGNFPRGKTELKHPKNIPHEVHWGRFRLSGKVRLIGFVIPKELAELENSKIHNRNFQYCTNTFYVVFLDKDHLFYQTEKKNT